MDINSYEIYLNELFQLAVSTKGTANESVEEVLMKKAVSCGRAEDAAKEDVKHILNIRSAVSILIKKAATNIKK